MTATKVRGLLFGVLALALAACASIPAPVVVDVSGTWNGSFTCTEGCTEVGFPITMVLVQSGTQVTGTINEGLISSGSLDEDQLTVTTSETFTIDDLPATFTFVGIVQGDTMNGTFDFTSQFGNGGGSFSATREQAQ